jgi:hypothetical protein
MTMLQVSPPGMHMLHLCFADDIRNPECEPSLVGTEFQVANEKQITAAEAMIDKLSLGESAYVGMFQNPMLQRHYQVWPDDKLNPTIYTFMYSPLQALHMCQRCAHKRMNNSKVGEQFLFSLLNSMLCEMHFGKASMWYFIRCWRPWRSQRHRQSLRTSCSPILRACRRWQRMRSRPSR